MIAKHAQDQIEEFVNKGEMADLPPALQILLACVEISAQLQRGDKSKEEETLAAFELLKKAKSEIRLLLAGCEASRQQIGD